MRHALRSSKKVELPPGFLRRKGCLVLRGGWLVRRASCLGPAGIIDYYILRKSELEHIHEYTTPHLPTNGLMAIVDALKFLIS
jgi:hypothetical protein